MSCGCGKIASGAIGLVKAAAGIDHAPKEVIASRRDICRGCDQKNTETLTVLSRCKGCGCYIRAKTTLASEKCPLGKW